MASTKIQFQYDRFNIPAFVEQYHNSTQNIINQVFIKFLNEVFRNERFLKGTSCLDLGCGPVLNRKYSDITVCDLLESNLLEVKKWLQKDKDALDCAESYKLVAAAENISDHNVIEERLRNAVKHVVLCDVLQENPLLNVTKQFDVVQCTFVVDNTAQDKSSLKSIIRNISNVVKPGGALVMINTLGATHYIVGEYKFTKIPLDKNLLEEALLEAGFEDIQMQETVHHGEFNSDTKGFIMSTAFKKQ